VSKCSRAGSHGLLSRSDDLTVLTALARQTRDWSPKSSRASSHGLLYRSDDLTVLTARPAQRGGCPLTPCTLVLERSSRSAAVILPAGRIGAPAGHPGQRLGIPTRASGVGARGLGLKGMASTITARDSSRQWSDEHWPRRTEVCSAPTTMRRRDQNMSATDKLVEKNCKLAELMRLAAKKH
jgi:hypothetical protein